MESHFWSHHNCAVARDVLAALNEVALSVLLHTGLAGAVGDGAVLR